MTGPAGLDPGLSSALLGTLLENVPCGVAFFDAAGSLVHFNGEARRLLADQYPGLIRGHVAEYANIGLRDDGSPYPFEEYALLRCLKTGEPQPREVMGFRLPDGQVAWAIMASVPIHDSATGALAGAAVSFVDITDRRRTEEALRHLVEETAGLFGKRFLDAMALHLATTFRMRFAFVGTFDAAAETVTTLSLVVDGMLSPPMTYSLAGTPCAQVLESGGICSHPEGVADRFRGDHLLVEMGVQSYFGFPLCAESGALMGLLVLMDGKPRQLTSEQQQILQLFAVRAGAELGRMRMESERALLLEQEQAARADAEAALSVRDVFLSVASHELKTPLAALQLQVEGLLRAARGESAVQLSQERLVAALEHANALGRRFGRLIDTLLDVSQISGTGALVLNREDFDLVSVVEEAIDYLSEPLARAGCDVIWSEVEHVRGSWDRFRLYQCVANLLSNAMKYGRGRPVELSVVRAGDGVRLSVRDHGIGIPADQTERVFERFARAHESHYGGLGLGLYIVRQILRAHGGAIRVESEPGQGSTFIVDLPITRGGEAAVA